MPASRSRRTAPRLPSRALLLTAALLALLIGGLPGALPSNALPNTVAGAPRPIVLLSATPTDLVAGTPVTLFAQATRAGKRPRVRLQRRDGGGAWTVVAKRRADRKGRVTFTDTPTVAGAASYRVQVRRAAGRAWTRSPAVTVTVRAPLPPPTPTTSTSRASVDANGGQAAQASASPALSSTGRYIAFTSYAPLAAPDSGTGLDVYWRDRITGETVLVSHSLAGDGPGDAASLEVDISADGQRVAYASDASNLVADDVEGHRDVFVWSRSGRTNVRASIDAAGQPSAEDAGGPSLDADGSRVAFATSAALVPEDANDGFDVYLRDLGTSTTTLVSVDGTGAAAGGSYTASISGAGDLVAFHSQAASYDGPTDNGYGDVVLWRESVGTTLLSTPVSGAADGSSYSPALSADGSTVAFVSQATRLVAADTNDLADVFVVPTAGGAVTRITPDDADAPSFDPDISADGSVVSFTSRATNLVPGDTNGLSDVFTWRRATGRITLSSRDRTFGPTDGDTDQPSLSGDGRLVAFTSLATDLVLGDTNDTNDVFVWSLATDG